MQAASTPTPMNDIHGIKPLEIPVSFEWLPLSVLGTVLVLVFVWTVYHFWKKFRYRRHVPPEIVISPHEAALGMLEALKDEKNTDCKIFYFRLSNILRTYLEARYCIHALEMTTEELIPQIDLLGIDKELFSSLKILIRSMDPVKFACVPVMVDKMRQDLETVRFFITQSVDELVKSQFSDGFVKSSQTRRANSEE